eukprot:COSAG05_NODE_922_length_6585_cov_180.946038_3_plen_39_part_00
MFQLGEYPRVAASRRTLRFFGRLLVASSQLFCLLFARF